METKKAEYGKQLDSTIESIEESIEKGTTTGASTSINSWIKVLEGNKDLKGIASDLEKLKDALTAKDGKKIVDLLDKLGSATTKAAEGAEGAEGTKIKGLGKALSAGSKALSKLVK